MAVYLDFVNFFTLLASVLCITVVMYFKHAHTYWIRKGVPQITPSFPFGNTAKVILRKQNMGERIKEIYDIMKPRGYQCVGLYFFSRKGILALSPELVRNILTKDFHHFHDRGIHYDEENDPLSAHLFSLSGLKWKNLRAKFTPTFTPGKVKYMFDAYSVCGDQMIEILLDMADKCEEVEMKDIMARFTTDVIGSCAFGLDCNTMKEPHTEFREMGRRAFTQTRGDMFKVAIIRCLPRLAKLLGFGMFAPSVTNFFRRVVRETVEYREKNNVIRKDFMQLLIQLKQKGQVEDDTNENSALLNEAGTTLTMDEAAAQAFIFFLAGFETTATTMSFALFELSVNSDIQERVRSEVVKVIKKYSNKLSYEAIMEMRYLDMVVSETLRKHPPAPVYLRKCTEEYRVPNTNVVIEKGFSVLIPTLALHRDPEYFPSPEKFDPERFNEENKSNIQNYTYLPFGEGPRICIGQRFALIQVKVGLSLILKNFKFTLNERTSLPLKMDTSGIILTPKTGIWLNLKKI